MNLMSETHRDRNKRQHNSLMLLGIGAMAQVMHIYKHILLYILPQSSTIISPPYFNASMLIAATATLSHTFASMGLFL